MYKGQGCGSALKEYGHWLAGEAAARFADKARDISEVLVDADLPLGELRLTVAYHDACHLVHGQKVRAQPRTLLRRIPGLTLVDIKDSELCCGSAGIYNLVEPEAAHQLGDRKVAHIEAVRPDVIATANPGCTLHMTAAGRRLGRVRPICHPIEILDASIRGGDLRQLTED